MTSTQNRKQVQRSAETRAKLIQATIDLLVEVGHAHITTNEISRRAGLSRGALHHHFEQKGDLWIATLEDAIRRMDANLSVCDVPAQIEERVDVMLERNWEVFGGNLFVACLEIRNLARLDSDLQARIKSVFLRVSKYRNNDWVNFFEDTGLSENHLILLRRLMLDMLRGFALRRITEGNDSISEAEISQAKSMIYRSLVSRE